MSRPLNKTRILITGVNGQVGFDLVRSLKVSGAELILSARNPTRSTLHGFPFVNLDLGRPKTVAQTILEVEPHIVINPAAYTAVDKAESEVDAAFAVNSDSVGELGKAMAKRNGAVIHFSTDYVYNPLHSDVNAEESPTKPVNVYAQSKLKGEQALAASGVAHLIFRTSWVYGLNGQNFVKTMLRLGRDRETLNVVNDQIGSPTSSETLAEAVAAILRTNAEDPLAFLKSKQGIYNICDKGFTSWQAYAIEIFRIAKELGFELKIQDVHGIPTAEYKTPANRPLNSRMALGKFETSFGLKTPDWQQSLSLFLAQLHLSPLR